MSAPVAVPLDPTLVMFLCADFHRGAIDAWSAVADRPLEEGIEALNKFFEDKERKIRGAYHHTMDEDDDEDEDDDDDEEEDEKLLDKDVKHASDEQVSTEDEQERRIARIAENLKSLAKEDSYRATLPKVTVLLVANVLEEREEALCNKVFIPKESKVSSDVKDYDEDEETAVETGKSLADEKKHARNEEMGVSLEGEKECKKARMEESPCCKGDRIDSGETKSFF